MQNIFLKGQTQKNTNLREMEVFSVTVNKIKLNVFKF